MTSDKKLTNWLPDSKEMIPRISKSISDIKFKIMSYNPVEYLSRIKPLSKVLRITEPRTVELLASGLYCFYGGLMMSLFQCNEIRNIDDVFGFTSLYLIIDHYIDDPSLIESHGSDGSLKSHGSDGSLKSHGSDGSLKSHGSDFIIDKSQFISSINSYITSGKKPVKSNSEIEEVIRIYDSIATTDERKKWLSYAWETEILGFKLQSSKTPDRENLLKCCKDKGAGTVQAIQSLLELKVTDDEYHLGACIQLVDDIADTFDDIRDNIKTIATYDYHKYGNLDILIKYTIDYIYTLHRKYNAFKIIMMNMIVYSISKNKFVSSDMFKFFEPYFILDKSDDILIFITNWLKIWLNKI